MMGISLFNSLVFNKLPFEPIKKKMTFLITCAKNSVLSIMIFKEEGYSLNTEYFSTKAFDFTISSILFLSKKNKLPN